LASQLLYQPQLSLIDGFEQCLYEQEPQSPDELRELWQKIELKYLPFITYEDAPFFTEGGRYLAFANWIMDYPLWSICYSLAQVSALQLWQEFKLDPEKGWQKYLKFCEQGGRASVMELLAQCGISSPLDEETVALVMRMVWQELDELDVALNRT